MSVAKPSSPRMYCWKAEVYADRLAAVAQQLLAEPVVLDAEVAPLDVNRVETRVPGQLPRDLGLALGRHPVALHQGRRVVPLGPLRHLRQGRGQVLLEVVGQLAVVVCRRGQGRQVEDVRQVVPPGDVERLEVEHRRDQDDPGRRDPPVQQRVGQPRRAGGSVALAHQIDRRTPALVSRQEQPDELADRINVAPEPVKLAVQLRLHRPAETGADGVDEDQVGVVEPGRAVLDQPERRRRELAAIGEGHPLWPERSEMEPDRR